MSAGQCKVDPVTGIAGAVYNAWLADPDAGFGTNLAALTISGSTARKLLAAQIEAFADEIAASVLTPPAWTISAQNANFNAAVWTHYRVTTSGGNVTATLPAAGAGNAGMDLTVIKLDAANTLTVASASLINGAASQAIVGQWDSVTVRSTGSTWDVVA